MQRVIGDAGQMTQARVGKTSKCSQWGRTGKLCCLCLLNHTWCFCLFSLNTPNQLSHLLTPGFWEHVPHGNAHRWTSVNFNVVPGALVCSETFRSTRMRLCAHTNKDCHLLPLCLTSALQAFVMTQVLAKTTASPGFGIFPKLGAFCSNFFFTLLLTSQLKSSSLEPYPNGSQATIIPRPPASPSIYSARFIISRPC